MKRAYFCSDNDGESGIAVIATSAREAKKLARGNDGLLNENYIDLTAKWCRDVKCDDLPIGVVEDYIEALRRGIYGFVEENCPKCETDTTLYRVEYHDGRPEEVMCCDCQEKEEGVKE